MRDKLWLGVENVVFGIAVASLYSARRGNQPFQLEIASVIFWL